MVNLLMEESNKTYTENGAAAYATTYSACLDLFSAIGALRREEDEKIITCFDRAFAEDADLAMKILFFARDIRGGIGERRVFRVLLKHLGNTYSTSAKKNIQFVAEYGRFDDLFELLGTPCEYEMFAYIKRQFDMDIQALEDNGNVSLLGKWLPSVNASDSVTVYMGKRVARTFGLTEKDYRQALSRLRRAIRIIENNLREGDYSFDYERQPSKAMMKYRKAFARNDGKRYSEYLQAVSEGKASINVGTLFPYEIIAPLFSEQVSDAERHSIDIMWNKQEDFTQNENALVVVDGSGSMYGGGTPLPASVALSLGIYFAERNKGAFQNHFITFSKNPQLVKITGHNIFEKVRYCAGFNEVANTNLQRVFELILNTAVKNNLPQSELPATLYIISDMEFDYCIDNAEETNFENAKRKYTEHGYILPHVVFWNAASRNGHQPVTMNEQGAVLVSGASPRIFSMVKTGTLSPVTFMMETLQEERYSKISA